MTPDLDARYHTPPPAITALVDAPDTPLLSLDPTDHWLLQVERAPLLSIADLALPEVKLAGLRFDPIHRTTSRQRHGRRMTLRPLLGGAEREVTGLPPEVAIERVGWSPDGRRIAFSLAVPTGLELWVAEADRATARRLTGPVLNSVAGGLFDWLPDSSGLVARTVPAGLGPAPGAAEVPAGPSVQQSSARSAPARTYQDLLRNPADEALFAYYVTSQVALIGLDGSFTPVGQPDLITRVEPSPDGRYLLISRLLRPFSYRVPLQRFARRNEVWRRDGAVAAVVAEVPLAEEVPVAFDAVRTGRRDVGWRDDAPATIFFLEALDQGDPAVDVPHRDRVALLPEPFTAEPVTLLELAYRVGSRASVTWGDGDLALVQEDWWKNRRTRTWAVAPDHAGRAPRLLFDRSFEDRYSDPGDPITRPTPQGTRVLRRAAGGQGIFLAGAGASAEGDRPFLDRFDLATATSERLWQSQPPYYEAPARLLDDAGERLILRRESAAEPPNLFLLQRATGQATPLTAFPHPAPQLRDVRKALIRYQRADGVWLTATLYLPPGYRDGDPPLPMIFWAYPREFKSADAAGQVTDSPYRFVRPSPHSAQFLLLAGYGVLDGPTIPIIGEGEAEANDTYVAQLRAGAEAAVKEVVRRGVGDPQRLAIGGHSYGAFTAANLLAHTDLFQAGIARSGAYNRTLTPFGFQAEERTLWQAPDIYQAMSPFTHADRINEPLLLIHGEADNNPGTFPLQSERLYNAVTGLGGTARLVLLPLESHGYAARESILHTMWEMLAWLDRYVKKR